MAIVIGIHGKTYNMKSFNFNLARDICTGQPNKSVLLARSVYLKLMVFSLTGTAWYFDSFGLPGFLAYVIFAVDAVVSFSLILGIKNTTIIRTDYSCFTWHNQRIRPAAGFYI